MMTRAQIESKILQFSLNRDVNGLRQLKADLENEQKKLDVWFDRYLDMFDKDMDPEEGDTAVWQLYRKKFRDYGEVSDTLVSLNYQIKKAGGNNASL